MTHRVHAFALVPGRVTRTFQNNVKHILDVFGLMVTPGHATLCGDGRFAGQHVPIIDILRSDGALVRADGSLVRACTGCDVDSPEDQFVQVITGTFEANGEVKVRASGRLRLGTRIILEDGRDVSLAEIIYAGGGQVGDNGLITTENSPFGVPFHWTFSDSLPLTETYILQRSGLQLADLFAAAEWEDIQPIIPAPMNGEAGASYVRQRRSTVRN